MKFDLISDMHVDTYSNDFSTGEMIYDWESEKQNETIVIAGDCANDPRITILVLMEAANYYEKVLFVDGNHEHYNGRPPRNSKEYHHIWNIDANVGYLRSFADLMPNVHFLNQESVVIENTTFIGCNGWYNFNSGQMYSIDKQQKAWKEQSGDGVWIDVGNINPKIRAQYDANWILWETINAKTEDVVVVTHTIPHPKGMLPDHHQWGQLNGMFENSFMHRVWKENPHDKIKTWVFGHTHFFYDFVDNGIHFLNNPRGYRGEKSNNHRKFQRIQSVDTKDNNYSAFGELER